MCELEKAFQETQYPDAHQRWVHAVFQNLLFSATLGSFTLSWCLLLHLNKQTNKTRQTETHPEYWTQKP
jgi:hypothetical protein